MKYFKYLLFLTVMIVISPDVSAQDSTSVAEQDSTSGSLIDINPQISRIEKNMKK